jgi:hypothetical protein
MKNIATPATLIIAPIISLILTFCLKIKTEAGIIRTGTMAIKVAAIPVLVF